MANGDTANKVGTFKFSYISKALSNSFFMSAAPLSTFDTKKKTGNEIIIEERDETEVTKINGRQIAPAGIHIYNPAFDITPHEFISGIITEKGILQGDYTKEIASLFEK
ncbi:hypothetical protein ACUIAK_08890 [Bacillus cytotoxicus]